MQITEELKTKLQEARAPEPPPKHARDMSATEYAAAKKQVTRERG